MTKIRLIFILIAFTALINSCKIDPNKQVDEGKVENEYYTSEDIGWTIKIPKGWTIMLKNQLDKNQNKGIDLIQETIDSEVDFSGLKHLISFQKNKANIFLSTSEPFELEYDGEFEESNIFVKQLITATYQNQGIKVDTSSSTAKIDNLTFDLFKIKIYNPKGDLILNQEMYSKLINGYMFSVTLTYNNLDDKNEMMEVWTKSKFVK